MGTIRELEAAFRAKGLSRREAEEAAAELIRQREEKLAMTYQRAQEQIAELEKAQKRLMEDGRRERGFMNGTQQELHDEIGREIQRIRMEAPANEPLSRPGAHLGGGTRALSGHSSGGEPYQTLGHQLQAVYRAGTPGGEVDPKLYQIRAASGLSESIPSEGGFLLQQGFSGELLQRIFTDPGSILSRVTRVQVGANVNSVDFPMVDETSRATGSRLGGVQTYWTAEAAAATPSKPKFRKLHLELKKLMGVCYATDELVQDATLLEFVVRNGFQSEIQFAVQDAVINGTGAGQPLGILSSGALVSVAKETGQQAATFTIENAVKMWARLPGRNRPNSVWLINGSGFETQLYTMALSVGTGGAPVFLPGGSASATPFMTLFGRPIIPVEQCAALGTVGDVILADLSEYILIDKGSVKEDVSIHVQFIYDELAYRFVYRCDGSPMAALPVTSFKGAVPQSAFIALAARS